MTLTKEQEKMCKLRLQEHQHDTYKVDIELKALTLKDFLVKKTVFRPETTSGIYLARYLAQNKWLYQEKKVLDMCCGTGIQGIVMGLLGATPVHFSDISSEAVENTKDNSDKFGLKAYVSCGDLFEHINEKFDLIVCNHPFFDSNPDLDVNITRAWFNNGELLHRFLMNAKEHVLKKGIILMPYFLFAGNTNNPALHARQHGFTVHIVHEEYVQDENIQQGMYHIYQLTQKH